MNNTQIISVREFARRIDLDESTIRQYIKGRRFKNGIVVNERGINKVNYPIALKELRRFGGGNRKRTLSRTLPQQADTIFEGLRLVVDGVMTCQEKGIPIETIYKAIGAELIRLTQTS